MAGFGGAIASRLLRALKIGKGTAEEVRAGARPIVPVGTSTAGVIGPAPTRAKQRAPLPKRERKQR